MTVTLDLSKETGIDGYIVLEETNMNMRKVWVMEKEMSLFSIKQIEKHNTYAKLEAFINYNEEYVYKMIDFLIYFMNLNPLEYTDYFLDNTSINDLNNAVIKISSGLLKIDPVKTATEMKSQEEYRRMLKERFFFLDNSIKDFDYNEQQIMANLHISPSIFEQENYYRLNEIMAAQSAEERPTTGSGFLGQLNLNKETAQQAFKGKEE